MKVSEPLFVGQVVTHRQYGVGAITRLIPSNPNIVKAVFEGENQEQIVQAKYLKSAKV